MQLRYDKKLFILFLITGLLCFVSAVFYATESFAPEWRGSEAVSFISFSIFSILEGIGLVLTFVRRHKIDPIEMCKVTGRYGLTVNPIFCLGVLFLSVIAPHEEVNWLFVANIVLTALSMILRIVCVVMMNRKMAKREGGYIGLRNHCWIGAGFYLIILNFYILGAIKIQGIDIHDFIEKGIEMMTDLYAIITILEVAVGVLVLFQSLFLMISTYYSGVENTPFDFRTNLEKSKEIFKKYDVGFWISIFATFIIMIIAIVSAIKIFRAYISIAALNFVILLIRLPSYYYEKHVNKQTEKEKYEKFKKLHIPLLYCSAVLLLYSVVCIWVGSDFFSHISVSGRVAYISMGIFIPWSIVKTIMGTISYYKARKTGNPLRIMNATLDVLVAIYTIAKAIFIFAGATEIQEVHIIGIAAGTIISVYCIVVAITHLIIGIRGLRDRRIDYFKRHHEDGEA